MISLKSVLIWFWSMGISIAMMARDIKSGILLLAGITGVLIIDKFIK
jgi:hypothetical protein